MSETYPVTVAVQRPDGSTEQVRVGTATKSADGFSLKLGELSIGGQPVAASSYGGGSRPAARPAGGGDGMVFPPYGRSKGMPISGATMQDLEFYANGSRRSLADPSKSRFHDKERVLLAAIEAEIARQQGGGGGGMGGPDDSGIPPPGARRLGHSSAGRRRRAVLKKTTHRRRECTNAASAVTTAAARLPESRLLDVRVKRVP